MRKLFFYFIIGFIFISCGEKKEIKSEEKAEIEEVTDTVEQEVKYYEHEGFTPFQNIEQISYTIFLPTTFYKHNHDSCVVRAQHYFYSESDPYNYFEVKGYFRENETIGIKEYFSNTYTIEDEESGKIIENKKLIPEDSVFFATGYWTNFPDRKFLEITWFGKESVLQLYVNDYLANHQPYWENKIEFLLETGAKFD
jgi:hypothetical protein